MPLDSQTTTLWIQPTGGALGADVHGIDLSRDLDRPTYDMLADAWAKHFVLRFSGQKLDDDALMRFSRNWGELDRTPVGTAGQKVNGVAANAVDWIAVISNVKVEGKPIGGLGAYESVWHTDMSYNPLPPRASGTARAVQESRAPSRAHGALAAPPPSAPSHHASWSRG